MAAALLAQDRQRGARDVDDAIEIGFHLRAEIGVVAFLDRGDVAVTRVVHDDIEAAEGIDGLLNGRPRRSGISHVERDGAHALAILLYERGKILGTTRGRYETMARGENGLRQFVADATGTTANKPD